MSDGNTDAINRHLAEREAYDEQQYQETELQDLRDEVDALAAKLATCEKYRDRMRDVADGYEARAEAAEAALRNIVSHATCGTMKYKGQSINDVSVQITKIRNEIYDDGKRHGAEAALKTARRDALEEAMRWAESERQSCNAASDRVGAVAYRRLYLKIRALIEEETKP